MDQFLGSSMPALPLAAALTAAACAVIAFALVVAGSSFPLLRGDNKSPSARRRQRPPAKRRTSLMSALQVDRSLLVQSIGMRQNVVNALLFFGERDAPTRSELVQLMTILARRFERMRSRPQIQPDGKMCVWEPIDDLEGAIGRAVTEDRAEVGDGGTSVGGNAEALHRFEWYKSQILRGEDDDGEPMPYWRVVLLSPSTVLVRIDHSVGDGLALVTLLREVGTKGADGGGDAPLRLGDLSPLLKRIEAMADWRVALYPWKLLWLPNLWRAASFIASNLTSPLEPANPLRPPPEYVFEPTPVENCGTVYFPTIRLSLLKQLARMAGDDTTINDVVLVCLADAFSKYFEQVGVKNVDSVRLLLPIGNPIRPSLYGDEYEGLCNHITPVPFTLKLGAEPRKSLDEIKRYRKKVKASNATLLMTVLNIISDRLLSVRQVSRTARDVFQRVSCVYTNVPGPPEAVFIAGHRITGIQTAMPHPTSIFQVLSYDGKCFFNITLDTRSAPRPWLLRDAFVDAIGNFASAWDELRNETKAEIDACAQANEWGRGEVVFTFNNT